MAAQPPQGAAQPPQGALARRAAANAGLALDLKIRALRGEADDLRAELQDARAGQLAAALTLQSLAMALAVTPAEGDARAKLAAAIQQSQDSALGLRPMPAGLVQVVPALRDWVPPDPAAAAGAAAGQQVLDAAMRLLLDWLLPLPRAP